MLGIFHCESDMTSDFDYMTLKHGAMAIIGSALHQFFIIRSNPSLYVQLAFTLIVAMPRVSVIPRAVVYVLGHCAVLDVGQNTQVRRNYTTPHKTQMIDTTINLLVNRTECTNLSGTTLTLRLAVKSDNSSPAILFRDSEKLDATIKLSLTLPTHSCRCPHGRTKSCFSHNNFSKFHKLRSL